MSSPYVFRAPGSGTCSLPHLVKDDTVLYCYAVAFASKLLFIMKHTCTFIPQASMFFLLTLCLVPACTHRQSQKTRIKTKEVTQTPAVTSPWSSKKISELSLDEAWGAYKYYKDNNRLPHLAAVLERLILLTPDQSQLEPLLTELSSLKITLGLYEEAETLLEEYCTMYPGNLETPKKKLQLIKVRLEQNQSPERDLSKAEKALSNGYELYREEIKEERDGLSKQEKEELIKLIHMAQNLLMTKALNKATFYATRYRYSQKSPSLRAAINTTRLAITTLNTQPEPRLLTAPTQKTLEQLANEVTAIESSTDSTPDEQVGQVENIIQTIKNLIQG